MRSVWQQASQIGSCASLAAAVVRGSDCNFSHRVSEDYGKTFKDVTHLINHTFVQTDFGIAISPDHSGKVRYCAIFKNFLWNIYFLPFLERIFPHCCCLWFQVMLTGDISEIDGFRLFRSRDFGMTFVSTDLPFEPLIQMLYNPGDCDTLLTLSIKVSDQIRPQNPRRCAIFSFNPLNWMSPLFRLSTLRYHLIR